MAKSKPKKLPLVKTWSELYKLCADGDERWQRVVIGALSNLGNPTLNYNPAKGEPLWRCAYFGLQEYIGALVGEYGETETQAEKSVLAEVNNVRDMCDDVKLV